MKDYLDIDGTPTEEPCAQVGTPDYIVMAGLECRAFREQLIRKFGNPPGNASITIGQNPHDFGTYLSLKLHFNDNRDEEVEWAYRVEGDTPYNWDEEAIRFLNSNNYFIEGKEVRYSPKRP